MTHDVENILKSFMKHFGALNRDIPDARNAYSDLQKTVHKDGALPGKFKELICIVASVLKVWYIIPNRQSHKVRRGKKSWKHVQ